MIELNEITTADGNWPFVESLFLEAFPVDERRPVEAQRDNVDNDARFHCLLATDDDAPVGFITYWDFESYCYCEHFATAPLSRNGGRGSIILQRLLQLTGKPLVLEVEPPADEMTRRRVAFYSRNGLVLHDDFSYIQPSYRPDGKPVPLKLMSSPSIDPDSLEAIAGSIHRVVYGKS